MDLNGSQQMHCRTKIGDEDGDIISKLPDGILHSVLNFLPTKDAIRTSVLSRRWEYLWTSLSNLNLHEWSSSSTFRPHHQSMAFLNFVDRVLMLHDDSDIKSFRLRVSEPVEASRVNSWVSTAVRHNCNQLDLSVIEGLPCCLFTCQSLTDLNISFIFILKVPTSVHLPSLKCLQLSHVKLGINWSNLFSSCPVLEELTLTECELQKCLTIANPSLKSLTIYMMWGKLWEELEGEIKVYAASLTSFSFVNAFGSNMMDVSLFNSPSLVNAHIWYHESGAHCTSKLLAQMHNVKSLVVYHDTLLGIWGAENLLLQLPVFQNLTCLQVIRDQIYFVTGKSVVDFMLKIPNLESLSIKTDTNGPGSGERMDDEDILEVVPCCLHSKLKTFELSCFIGEEIEMHLLEFVLKNAAVLELVRISVHLDEESNFFEKLELARKEIQLLPRCSEKCQILISRCSGKCRVLRVF